jgi:alkanesulfonate monooxygenase SsuD/methylene tetrahydromethanopterin reductase-like flavin-dependent oxidoreductase (luciferase family)
MASLTELPRVGVVFRPQLPPERMREFVLTAEAAGLDDVWLWEDCFAEGGLASASAALAWTSTLRIGLGLMPVPLRNPAVAAMEIATLQRLFPGRFVPAVGHGVLSWMEQVGARVRSPMTLLREWVSAARALLHGERVTTRGEYIRLDQVALDWPPETAPPVLVGARGPKTLALAGELADGLVLDAGISPEGVKRAVARAAAPRPHEVVVYVLCGAGPDARDRIEAELAELRQPLEDRGAFGSAEDVARVIAGFHAVGATSVILQPTATDPDVSATIQLAAAARSALVASNTTSAGASA